MSLLPGQYTTLQQTPLQGVLATLPAKTQPINPLVLGLSMKTLFTRDMLNML